MRGINRNLSSSSGLGSTNPTAVATAVFRQSTTPDVNPSSHGGSSAGGGFSQTVS